MQGILPCKDGGICPYGEICEECPELRIRAEDKRAPKEKGGFYGREVREVLGPDGKKHFDYSHPE